MTILYRNPIPTPPPPILTVPYSTFSQNQIDNKMVSDKSSTSSRVVERQPRTTMPHEGTTTIASAAIPVYVMSAFSVGLLMGSMIMTRSVAVH